MLSCQRDERNCRLAEATNTRPRTSVRSLIPSPVFPIFRSSRPPPISKTNIHRKCEKPRPPRVPAAYHVYFPAAIDASTKQPTAPVRNQRRAEESSKNVTLRSNVPTKLSIERDPIAAPKGACPRGAPLGTRQLILSRHPVRWHASRKCTITVTPFGRRVCHGHMPTDERT